MGITLFGHEGYWVIPIRNHPRKGRSVYEEWWAPQLPLTHQPGRLTHTGEDSTHTCPVQMVRRGGSWGHSTDTQNKPDHS